MAKSLIVIPTYNERENISLLLSRLMALKVEDLSVLVVDDKSPDRTFRVVQSLQDKYEGRLHLIVNQKKIGLGNAYLIGFDWALKHNYDYILQMDADFSHNPKDVPRLLEACQNNKADLVIGSRYSDGVNVVNWPMNRVLLSYLASKYVRLITGLPLADTTAGFTCSNHLVIRYIMRSNLSMEGYAFQIELKYRAWKKGFRLKEIPIIFIDRERGVSKLDRRIINEAIFGVIKLRIGQFFKR